MGRGAVGGRAEVEDEAVGSGSGEGMMRAGAGEVSADRSSLCVYEAIHGEPTSVHGYAIRAELITPFVCIVQRKAVVEAVTRNPSFWN